MQVSVSNTRRGRPDRSAGDRRVGADGLLGELRRKRGPEARSTVSMMRRVIIVSMLVAASVLAVVEPPRVAAAESARAIALSEMGGDRACGIHADATLSCWGGSSIETVPSGTFTDVAAGANHSCAVRSTGGVVCWGDGSSDQDGRTAAPSGTFRQVTAGVAHSCALRTDGRITCWGFSTVGATNAPPGNDFVSISASYDHGCAIRASGAMTCWGSPAAIDATPASGRFKAVSAGQDQSCAIRLDGTVVCWGITERNVVLDPPGGTFVDVAVGNAAACGIRSNGRIVCWGSNSDGVLDPPGGSFVEVSVGSGDACARDTSGGIQCWPSPIGSIGPPRSGYESVEVGLNYFGLCLVRPDGYRECDQAPLPDWVDPASMVDVEIGDQSACVVTDDGRLRCFGNELFGIEDTPDGSFVDAELSGTYGCALTVEGAVRCWGGSQFPLPPPPPPPGKFANLSVGYGAVCALTTTGVVACTARPEDPDDPGFAIVDLPSGVFADIAVGAEHICGIRLDGTIECFGRNAGSVAPSGNDFVDIQAAYDQFCALEGGSGEIRCWSLYEEPFTAFAVPAGEFEQFSLGSEMVCGIRTDGVAQCSGGVMSGEPFTPSPMRPWPGVRTQQPVRILDTRSHDAAVSGPHPSRSGAVLGLDVQHSVPPTASAVAVTVTVVDPDGPGNVIVWPCDEEQPLASSVNYLAGQVVANTVIVGMDNSWGGRICLLPSSPTDLVVDVVGHVPAFGTLVPVVPARFVDTRPGESTVDGGSAGIGRVAAGGTLEIDTWGRGGVPVGAEAVVVNVVAAEPSDVGFLTIFPCGKGVPLASNLNYTQAYTTNMAFTPVGAGGKVCVFSRAETDLVVDVNAFVPAGARPAGIVPVRFADTRLGESTVDGVGAGTGRVAAGTTLRVDVTGRGGVPSGAATVMANVAVVAPDAPGFLTVYPCGSRVPLASTLNYAPGDVRAAAVPVGVGEGGEICIFTLASAEIVVDVNGYELP